LRLWCAVFDAALLLRRSEQAYTRLVAEHTQEGDVREFVICVRQKGSKSYGAMGDWLPVAELALVSQWDASVALPIALPVLCRCAHDTLSQSLIFVKVFKSKIHVYYLIIQHRLTSARLSNSMASGGLKIERK
jgi:hypothetical protein